MQVEREKGKVQGEGRESKRGRKGSREAKGGLVGGVRLTIRALWRHCKASVLSLLAV
jgi:hypothetical protein